MQLLLYVLDASASEAGRSPQADLACLEEELRLYDEELMEKPALIFANKYDLAGRNQFVFIYCLCGRWCTFVALNLSVYSTLLFIVNAVHRKKLDRLARKMGLEVIAGRYVHRIQNYCFGSYVTRFRDSILFFSRVFVFTIQCTGRVGYSPFGTQATRDVAQHHECQWHARASKCHRR